MNTYTKGQLVRVTRQERSAHWSLAEDSALGIYLGRNDDPEDAPYVNIIAVENYDRVQIMSDEEVEAA